MLAGVAGRVTRILPAANVAENPAVEYLMDPHDQLRHFRTIEEQGLELLGIYHSHPTSPAYPSLTDLSMACYPEAVYVIVSLMKSDAPTLRAFRIVDREVSEVGFRVVPPTAELALSICVSSRKSGETSGAPTASGALLPQYCDHKSAKNLVDKSSFL